MPSDIKLEKHHKKIQFTAPVQLNFADEDGGDKSKLPTFEMVAYTGNAVERFFGKVVVDLAGMKISKKSRPILRGHNTSKIVGHSTEIEKTSRRLNVSGVISAENEHSEEIVKSSKNGFPWQASIGADITIKKIKFYDKAEKVNVNGRNFKGPIWVYQESELSEVSFVPLGADDDTSAKIAASREEAADEQNLIENEGENMTIAATKESEKKQNHSDKTPDVSADDHQAILDKQRQETASQLKLQAGIKKVCGDNLELAAQAIEEGWTLEKAELEAERVQHKLKLEQVRKSREDLPAAHSKNNDIKPEVLEASFSMSLGIRPDDLKLSHENPEGFSEEVIDMAVSREHRGATLYDLALAVTREAGIHMRPGRMNDESFEKFQDAMRKLAFDGSAVGPHSLTSVLGNSMHKSLMAAYRSTAGIATDVCFIDSQSDFKTHTRHTMNASGDFVIVPDGGNIESGQYSEETSTSQLDTYGRKWQYTRRQWINDDLGALRRMPIEIGRKGRNAVERLLAKTINTNAGSFYHADNNNLLTGSNSAFGYSALSAAVSAFLKQVDPDGDPIAVDSWGLIVSASNKVPADEMFTSDRVNETTTANKKSPAKNIHEGKYMPHTSPWLHHTIDGVTGSDLAWYLIANPNDLATYVLAFLNGQQTPNLRIDRFMKNSQAIEFESFFDFAVSQHNHRAAVKNKGEA